MLKELAAERDKEFYVLVQTLLHQQDALIVTSNVANYFPLSGLDDDTKSAFFRRTTARMNQEGQSWFVDVVDAETDLLIGCCGLIKINRMRKFAHFMFILYQEHMLYMDQYFADVIHAHVATKFRLRYLLANISGPSVSSEVMAILEKHGFYRQIPSKADESQPAQDIWLQFDYDYAEGTSQSVASASDDDGSTSKRSVGSTHASSVGSLSSRMSGTPPRKGASAVTIADVSAACTTTTTSTSTSGSPEEQNAKIQALPSEVITATTTTTTSTSSHHPSTMKQSGATNMTMNMTGAHEIRVCEFWKRGRCIYGAECRFAHDWQQQQQQQQSASPTLTATDVAGRRMWPPQTIFHQQQQTTTTTQTQQHVMDRVSTALLPPPPSPCPAPVSASVSAAAAPRHSPFPLPPTKVTTTMPAAVASVQLPPSHPAAANTVGGVGGDGAATINTAASALSIQYPVAHSSMPFEREDEEEDEDHTAAGKLTGGEANRGKVSPSAAEILLDMINTAYLQWLVHLRYIDSANTAQEQRQQDTHQGSEVFSQSMIETLLRYRSGNQCGLNNLFPSITAVLIQLERNAAPRSVRQFVHINDAISKAYQSIKLQVYTNWVFNLRAMSAARTMQAEQAHVQHAQQMLLAKQTQQQTQRQFTTESLISNTAIRSTTSRASFKSSSHQPRFNKSNRKSHWSRRKSAGVSGSNEGDAAATTTATAATTTTVPAASLRASVSTIVPSDYYDARQQQQPHQHRQKQSADDATMDTSDITAVGSLNTPAGMDATTAKMATTSTAHRRKFRAGRSTGSGTSQGPTPTNTATCSVSPPPPASSMTTKDSGSWGLQTPLPPPPPSSSSSSSSSSSPPAT